MLVNGVDISMLEGWMVKINSNPGFFGKNTSRRWFKVGFAGASGGDQKKLIISYSTNKTSKEPRGWLYVEDVSGVYCRKDMIEIVSPARTLRLKGETSAEHRLWSDSLYRLCNPSKASEAPSDAKKTVTASPRNAIPESKSSARRQEPSTAAEAKRTVEKQPQVSASSTERSHAQAKATRVPERQRDDSDDDSRDRGRSRSRSGSESEEDDGNDDDRGRPRSNGRQQVSESKAAPSRSSPARDQRSRSSSRASSRSDDSREPPRREADRPRDDRHDNRDSESGSDRDSGDSDDDDRGEAKRRSSPRAEDNNSTGPRRQNLLVSQIKAATPSSVVAAPRSPKFSEIEDEANSPVRQVQPSSTAFSERRDMQRQQHSEEEHPQEESPRESEPPAASQPIDRDTEEPSASNAQMRSGREEQHSERQQPAKRDSGAYFDSDDEDQGPSEPPSKTASKPTAVAAPKLAPQSEVARDNNFVEDDWDADDAPRAGVAPVTTKHPANPGVGIGNVAADSNFATDDWD